MNYIVYLGVAIAGFMTPVIVYEVSKCSLKRQLKNNIAKLEKQDIQLKELIQIHKDKLDELKKTFYELKKS